MTIACKLLGCIVSTLLLTSRHFHVGIRHILCSVCPGSRTRLRRSYMHQSATALLIHIKQHSERFRYDNCLPPAKAWSWRTVWLLTRNVGVTDIWHDATSSLESVQSANVHAAHRPTLSSWRPASSWLERNSDASLSRQDNIVEHCLYHIRWD